MQALTPARLAAAAVATAAIAGAGFAAVWAWAIGVESYNIWGALLVVPVIFWINAILIWRVASRASEAWLGKVMAWGFAAKMVGTMARYYVAYVVYDSATDAERYNLAAAFQYRTWREGVITWDFTSARGTQYMELITTAIYTVIGPTTLAAFFVYASFAFWGAYLLFKAFRVALPHGDARRYALLVFFLPSLLYWPSSIGKESWILLFVGVTALGAAKFFARQRGAMALLALGAFGTGLIRPHIAVLLFAALLVAQLFRPASTEVTGVLSKAAGILVMSGAAWVLATQSAQLLGTDDISWASVFEALDMASGRTTQGGSEFDPVDLSSPFGLPMAAITLLFRPFPWESMNAQMLIQSLEGLFLVVLAARAWPRLKQVPRVIRRNPYVLFAVIFSVGYIIAFAGFANFGILARQRVLMLPFLLILLAIPLPERAEHEDGQDEPGDVREEWTREALRGA